METNVELQFQSQGHKGRPGQAKGECRVVGHIWTASVLSFPQPWGAGEALRILTDNLKGGEVVVSDLYDRIAAVAAEAE